MVLQNTELLELSRQILELTKQIRVRQRPGVVARAR
jgi:hypothetical protein